jgi:hypothetical protein
MSPMRYFSGHQSLNWTQAVSQNQASFRGLNNRSNMSQCHKQSSKLRIKHTIRISYIQNHPPQSDET